MAESVEWKARVRNQKKKRNPIWICRGEYAKLLLEFVTEPKGELNESVGAAKVPPTK